MQYYFGSAGQRASDNHLHPGAGPASGPPLGLPGCWLQSQNSHLAAYHNLQWNITYNVTFCYNQTGQDRNIIQLASRCHEEGTWLHTVWLSCPLLQMCCQPLHWSTHSLILHEPWWSTIMSTRFCHWPLLSQTKATHTYNPHPHTLYFKTHFYLYITLSTVLRLPLGFIITIFCTFSFPPRKVNRIQDSVVTILTTLQARRPRVQFLAWTRDFSPTHPLFPGPN